MARKINAIGLTGALIYAFSIIAHVALHLTSAERGLQFTAIDVVGALSSLFALGLAVRGLGFGYRGSERRRRLALIRAELPRGVAFVVCAAALEALIALGLLIAEGEPLGLSPLLLALISGVIALLLTACCLRAVQRRFVALIAWCLAPLSSGDLPAILGAFAVKRAHSAALRAADTRGVRGPPHLLARVG
jgi:hypothetical protein